jgi:pimeloyl-ACP methyl ester carboxylesterase
MHRRAILRFLGMAGAAGVIPSVLQHRASAQTSIRYDIQGTGPSLIVFNREPKGYFEGFADRYRVIVMDYPPQDNTEAFAESFTADHVCADILAVADAVDAERFAWFGFSWGAVVGLQLAGRTKRLTALVGGGWPPLGGQYQETLAVTEKGSQTNPYATFYRSIRNWNEREAVAKITCPRMAFVGSRDQFVAQGYPIRIGPLVAEHREELERMGWAVRIVDGFGHELGGRPDVVVPLVREFLDPLLLRA